MSKPGENPPRAVVGQPVAAGKQSARPLESIIWQMTTVWGERVVGWPRKHNRV